jgi:hypothetical protein
VLLSSLGDTAALAEFITGDWNPHLIIRGNTLIHMLNGHDVCGDRRRRTQSTMKANPCRLRRSPNESRIQKLPLKELRPIPRF